MPGGPEHTIVEMPIIHSLTHLGYHYLRPEQNDFARDGQNNVILRDVFLQSIREINSITEDVANSVYQELLSIRDNEKWTSVLRGNYSKSVPGEAKKKTIYPIDFREPGNNTFTVTNQFYVES
jgi:type I restriction enzyme R subunit